MTIRDIPDLALATDPKTAPPKRWRNKWRANATLHISCKCSRPRLFIPDETFFSCCTTWPSKDLAETVARERMSLELAQFGYPLAEWINAYPDPD